MKKRTLKNVRSSRFDVDVLVLTPETRNLKPTPEYSEKSIVHRDFAVDDVSGGAFLFFENGVKESLS
jgi:hypothetical protein